MQRNGKTFKRTTSPVQKKRRKSLRKEKELQGGISDRNEERGDEYKLGTQPNINDGAETNTGQLNRVMESSVKRDWLYADMIKYFKKKEGFLSFKKQLSKSKVDEELSCTEQIWLQDLQHLEKQIGLQED